jgi:hypothetical protein
MAHSSKTVADATSRDFDSLPIPPKILDSYKRRWREPELFDTMEVGPDGLWVAMHGGEIVATDPSHTEVLRQVEDYGPDDILMVYLPPDDDTIEIY